MSIHRPVVEGPFVADLDNSERWQRQSRKPLPDGWCAWCGVTTKDQRFCSLACKLDHDVDVAVSAA